MNDIALRLSDLLVGAAARLEHAFGTEPSVMTHELYFDSEAYLSDLKNRIYTRYY